MRCGKCGGFVKEDTVTCPFCGEALKEKREEAMRQQPRVQEAAASKKGLLRFVLMGLMGLALITALFIPFIGNKKTGKGVIFLNMFGTKGLDAIASVFILLLIFAIILFGIVYGCWILFAKHDEFKNYSYRRNKPISKKNNKAIAEKGDGYRLQNVAVTLIMGSLMFPIMKLFVSLIGSASSSAGTKIVGDLFDGYKAFAGSWLMLGIGVAVLVCAILITKENQSNKAKRGTSPMGKEQSE